MVQYRSKSHPYKHWARSRPKRLSPNPIWFSYNMNVVVGAISSSSATALRFNYSSFLSFSSSKTLISSPFGRGRRRTTIHEISSPLLPMLYTTTKISSSASTAEGEVEFKSAKPQPWLIVGLGNPGKIFNRTRHNVRTTLSLSLMLHLLNEFLNSKFWLHSYVYI